MTSRPAIVGLIALTAVGWGCTDETSADPTVSGGGGAAASGQRACADFEAFTVHPDGAPLQYASGNKLKGWDPYVIIDPNGGDYHAFFSRSTNMEKGIASATSKDGIVWTEVSTPSGFVLEGQEGDWDQHMETNTVVHHDGQFWMWYLGYPCTAPEGENGRHKCIGLATSTDGVAWSRHPNPVLTPELDFEQPYQYCEDGTKSVAECPEELVYWNGGLQEPSVLWDESAALFRMWYAGTTTEIITQKKNGEMVTGLTKISKLGYATSSDGINWERRVEPVFEWDPAFAGEFPPFPIHTNVTRDPGAGFHLFYLGNATLHHAYSADGLEWTRNPNNPVLPKWGEGGEIHKLGGPAAVWSSDNTVDLYHMMCESQPASTQSYCLVGMNVALATGTCG